MNLSINKGEWSLVKFGDVVTEVKDRIASPAESDFDRFIGLEHFVSGDLKIKNWKPTDDLTSSGKAFKPGDILFARRNAYLRRASLVDFSGVCSGDAFVLRENRGKIVPGFAAFIVNSDRLWDYANANAAGTMSKRVKFRDLANYQFLLPPKPEQARLAELLWAGDEVLEGLEKTLNHLEILENSAIKDYFKEADQIRAVNLEHVGKWLSGGTPSKKNKNYWEGDIPWVSPKDMKVRIIKDSIDHVSLEGAKAGSRLIPKGSLLIVVRGLILAHTFPIAITARGVCFNQDMKALVCNEGFLPEFISYFLRYKTPLVLNSVTTTTHGTKRLASDSLFSLKVPNLPIPQQKILVDRINKIRNNFLSSKSSTTSTRALQKSLINQIF